tara:strand:+ start:1311 stop:2204 length:894 start_codon:yes stop_codon:yes gene_type:complete
LFDILEKPQTFTALIKRLKQNTTDIFDNLDDKKKYPTYDIFIQDYLDIREQKTFEYIKELITTFKNGCMSVNTPLKELMNTVLIRYRSPKSSFEYTDGKILPLGAVHLNGHYNTKSVHISPKNEISSIEIYPNQITRVFPSFKFGEGDLLEEDKLIEKTLKKEDTPPEETDGKISCKQKSKYKNLNKSIKNMNYVDMFEGLIDKLIRINMLAFNWHDICEKELKELTNAFRFTYEPFLRSIRSEVQEVPEVPTVPEVPKKNKRPSASGVNGGSRKKRNLKKKNSKKGKRRRRKSRKL